MRFTLHHKFIASIAAAAVAITAFTAAPAAAGDRNRDLAKIAAGILGVAIVGKIIHDKNNVPGRKYQSTAMRQTLCTAPHALNGPSACPSTARRNRATG